MSNFMERVLHRPIIHISNDPADEQPIIGFVKEIKLGQMIVEDYVEYRRVFVPDQGTVIFTQQRFTMMFDAPQELLLSFIYKRSDEGPVIDKPRKCNWNYHYVMDKLERNGFWTAYKQYQERKDEQPAEEI